MLCCAISAWDTMPLLDEDCANPLLVGWIREGWDTARERSSKGALTYKHAYDSLRAYPITFTHPAQLQQLRGFGGIIGCIGHYYKQVHKH